MMEVKQQPSRLSSDLSKHVVHTRALSYPHDQAHGYMCMCTSDTHKKKEKLMTSQILAFYMQYSSAPICLYFHMCVYIHRIQVYMSTSLSSERHTEGGKGGRRKNKFLVRYNYSPGKYCGIFPN